MNKQRMIISDNQLLIDMELLFNAIREANGDWEQVEEDMWQMLESVQNMTQYGQSESDEDMIENSVDEITEKPEKNQKET